MYIVYILLYSIAIHIIVVLINIIAVLLCIVTANCVSLFTQFSLMSISNKVVAIY